jgi:hypothetical protein
VFGCVCYPNLSAQATHKLTPQSTLCVFLGSFADHKGYQCLDLSTDNIIISRHVFDEVVFLFAASPRLTNDLDIFLQDDALGVTPMLATLPAPRVPLGFPSLAVGGGLTAPETEADSHIVSPDGQTTPGTEADSPTATPSGQSARPLVAPSSVTSPTSVAPHVAPTTLAAPHAASTTPPAPPAALTS